MSRGLSSQLGELTEETDYGQLQKAYSIWVCYDPHMPNSIKNTVSQYKISKKDLIGEVEEPTENYDLMEVVFVRIDTNSESDVKIFDYLKGIFTNDKEKIIKQTGPLPDKVDKEVDDMSGVGALIYDKGREEERRAQIERLLKKGKTPEDIAEYNDYPLELVRSVQESLLITQ